MDKKEYDIFNLITQAQICIEWLQETEKKSSSKEAFCNVVENYKKQNENISLFNQGTCLMYAYMSLVMPKESVFSGLYKKLKDKIDTSNFKIINDTYNDNNIVRHVRNALAHGQIEVENNSFKFTDKDNKNKQIELKIEFSDFGYFVSNFYYLSKKTFFENNH